MSSAQRAAHRHGDRHEPLAARCGRRRARPRRSPAPPTAMMPKASERHDRAACGAAATRAHRLARRDARRDEDRDPRPEAVELDHVAEVAAGREAPASLAHHLADQAPREGARRKRDTARRDSRGDTSGAASTAQADAARTTGRSRRRRAAACTRYGSRLADGERADDGADREPAPRAEPGGRHLHRRRIDAGEEESGGEPRSERRLVAGQRRAARRWPAAPRRARAAKSAPRRHDVGEVEQRRQRRAARRSPSCTIVVSHAASLARERPRAREHRRHGARREPERHAEQLGGREQGEHAPARGVRVAGRRVRCRSGARLTRRGDTLWR